MSELMHEELAAPLPDWAVGTANAHTQVGAQLRTRDGRRVGNAVTAAWPIERHGIQIAEVLTDVGNTLNLTPRELDELFYPPEWVMDATAWPGRFAGRELSPRQVQALHGLITAAASLSAIADSGALGEGYDGAEPQRTAAVAALDELAEANHAAMLAFADLIASRAPLEVVPL